MQCRPVFSMMFSFMILAAMAYGAGPTGVVVNDKGDPVGGAEVALHHQTAAAQMAPASGIVERVKTDARGRFSLKTPTRFRPVDSYIRGTETYALLATHPDFAIGWAGIEQGKEKTSYTLILTKPRSIEITVTDIAGEPLEGARVFPYALGKRNAKNPAFRDYIYAPSGGIPVGALSDAEGKATVTHLPKTQISFHASKAGYGTGLCFSGQKRIRLVKGATLHGAIKTPEGKPVAGVMVELRADWMSLTFLARTDAKGRYRLKDVAAKGWDMSPWGKSDQPGDGKFRVKCYGPNGGTTPEMLQLDAGADMTKDFTLERGCVLAGRVIDITTNKPVASMKISRYISVPGTSGLDSLDLVTDEEGRFRAIVPKGAEARLQPQESREGDYLIDEKWRQQNNHESFRQVVTQDMTDIELKVKLWAVQPLAGRVVDGDGKGVKATVHFHSDVPQVKTDGAGHFTLKTAPTDRDFDLFAITDDKKQAGLISLETGATKATIRLEPTRGYEGQAQTPDGLPAPNLNFYMDLHLNDDNIYRVRVEPKTDAEGHFKTEGLCPKATYYAWWSSDSKRNRDYDYGNATVELSKLKPDEPIRFEAKAYINALMGRVTDEEGKPIKGAKIAADPSDVMPQDARFNMPEIRSDAEGNFTITRLAAGKVSIRVSAEGYKSRSVTAPTDSFDLEVTLAKRTSENFVYAVTVRDGEDKPITGATVSYWERVYAQTGATTRSLTAKTDAEGHATFTRKPSEKKDRGAIVLGCDAGGYDLAYRGAAFDEDADVEFVLEKSGACWTGVVKDEQGQPIPGAKARVTFFRQGGEQGRYAHASIAQEKIEFQSDDQGAFRLPRIGSKNWVNVDIQAPGCSMLREYFDPNRDESPKTFTLSPGVEIIGKIVRADGKPLPAKLQAFARPLSNSGSSTHGSATADADGSFKIEGIKPGQYEVQARAGDLEHRDLLCPNPPTVTLVKGEPARVTVTLELGTLVEGKVVSADATKIDVANTFLHVLKNGKSASGAGIEEDGTWKTYLAPGEHVILLNFRGGKTQSVEQGKKITVEKGKPLSGILIKVK